MADRRSICRRRHYDQQQRSERKHGIVGERRAKTAREEGFGEIADWFETLARAEKSHAGRFKKGLDTIG